jgi:ribosomal protein S17
LKNKNAINALARIMKRDSDLEVQRDISMIKGESVEAAETRKIKKIARRRRTEWGIDTEMKSICDQAMPNHTIA